MSGRFLPNNRPTSVRESALKCLGENPARTGISTSRIDRSWRPIRSGRRRLYACLAIRAAAAILERVRDIRADTSLGFSRGDRLRNAVAGPARLGSTRRFSESLSPVADVDLSPAAYVCVSGTHGQCSSKLDLPVKVSGQYLGSKISTENIGYHGTRAPHPSSRFHPLGTS